MFNETSDFKMLGDEDELDIKKAEDWAFNPHIHEADLLRSSPINYLLRTISYSSLLTLHSCPRKFELNRLVPRVGNEDEDEAGHLDFGSIVGIGVQELIVTGDMNRAIFQMFLSWKDNLESERGEKSKKTFWHAIVAVQKFTEVSNGPLSSYEVTHFSGRPAIELGFAIDCGEGFRYRGKLDVLMIHKQTREFLPIEIKTTGSYSVDEAAYGNSSQGLGYGVVIDRVAHEMGIEYSSYHVLYPVYLTKAMEWRVFRFKKNNTERALWLQSLLLDIGDVGKYHSLEYFPTRGESCYSYGRQCRWYGTCSLQNEALMGEIEKIPVRYDKIGEYPLKFTIKELVEAQVERSRSAEENGVTENETITSS